MRAAAEAGPGAGGAETAGATWRSAAGAWPGRHVNLVPPLGQGLSSGGLAMAGLDFWGEGPLVGAKFPAGAAHGWWEGGKVLAALSSVTTRRALFPLLVVYNLFHQSVCAAVQTAGPPR